MEPRCHGRISAANKRNIHINSLPSDREVASKDCRRCTRRRIRCDRTKPKCLKCGSRGIDCSGFGNIHLRWDQGVASRGKLAGSALPVQGHGGAESSADLRPHGNETPIGRHHEYRKDSANGRRAMVEDEARQPASPTSSIAAQELNLVRRYSSIALLDNLLTHFHANVASLLTWIDGPQNPWRSIVLPLSQQSTCLRLSILSLAAAHLWTTTSRKVDQAAEPPQTNRGLWYGALQSLNNQLRCELNLGRAPPTDKAQNSSLDEILATMLVLCYGEMFVPGSTSWSIHLRACHAIMDRNKLQNPAKDPPRAPVTQFLVKEVADIEVFGCVSSFTRIPEVQCTLDFQWTTTKHFWPFTELVYDITTIERKRHSLSQEGRTVPDMDMAMWRAKIDEACTIALAGTASSPSPKGPQAVGHGFDAVIRAHYHAALIYSYQAFASFSEAAEIMPSVVSLLYEVQAIAEEPTGAFSHDIMFPLFIAGTECGADEYRRGVVRKLFLQSISRSGFWCNYSALQFLGAFWETRERPGNWIQYARETESTMSAFLLF